MRLLCASVLALTLLLASASTFGAPPKPADNAGGAMIVMPFGDDITQGDQGHASYRYWLFQRLREAGYHVSFVGSQRGLRGGAAAPHTDFDQAHEGHWHWTSSDAVKALPTIAASHPQYVVIDIGLNDLDQLDVAVRNLIRIIQGFRAGNPHIAIVLAQLTPAKGFEAQVTSLNKDIATIAKLAQSLDSPILTVNLASGFDPAKLTYDGIHPNEEGEKVIADRIFAALQVVMDHEAAIFTRPLPGHLARLNNLLGINDFGGASAELEDMLTGGGLNASETAAASDLMMDIGIYAATQRRRVEYLARQHRQYLAGPILERLAVQFRGVSIGHEALDILIAWRKNPAINKELSAGALMTRGQRQRIGPTYGDAYQAYQTVISKYPGTQAAADARKFAADLEKRGLAK